MNETPPNDPFSPASRPAAPAPVAKSRRFSPLAIVLGLSGLFFVIFLAVSGAMYATRGSGSGSRSTSGGAIFGKGSVGVIELKGVIMDSKKVVRQLDRFSEDENVKAIVLRLDSPGGSVAPSQEIYEAVKAFKKPLVVSMGSVAASGAFYIASAAKTVYANPGTITGSIGVIMEFVNLEKLYDWAKIKRYALKTGKYKGSGAEYREMTPEERELLQGMLDDVLIQFKTAVSQGRKLSMEQVTAIADGRVMSGNQALKAKLIDKLGTLQDAITEAGELADIKGKPRVIYPEKARARWMDLLLDRGGDDEDAESRSSDLGLLARLARAFLGGGSVGGHADEDPITGVAPGVYWLWGGVGH